MMMTVSTEPGAAADTAAPDPGPGRTEFRFGPAWLAALLIAGLLLGAGGMYWAVHATRPGDGSVEAGFLRDMSTHHSQAVAMSMIAHKGSTDPEVISLAADIAMTQHGQASTMQAWLRDWGLNPTGEQAPMAWMPDAQGSVRNGLMPGMATPEQMAALGQATGKDLDVQFLTLMRQHHLGGIHMAQAILDMSDHGDVTWLAGTMVTGQQGELNLIDSLLKKVQGTP
jgi:uncharacterized protein (DUF305 family)